MDLAPGKTSTVLRILALLAGQAGERPLRIALAAPTGGGGPFAGVDPRRRRCWIQLERLAQIPKKRPPALPARRPAGFGLFPLQTGDDPLPLDVLVVDEVSMVGLALLAKTVTALPAEARLILLGRQGSVGFGGSRGRCWAICAPGPAVSRRSSGARLATLTGDPLPRGRESLVAAGRCHRCCATVIASARTAVSARWRER